MRSFIAIALCFATSFSAFAGEGAYKLSFEGGSVTTFKTGEHLQLFLDQDKVRISGDKTAVLNLPASSITEITYGQDVHRRIGAAIGLAAVSLGAGALMAFTKSKKHYIGITWDDADKKGGAAFQADKNDYRGVLAGLEGITGRKAISSEATPVHVDDGRDWQTGTVIDSDTTKSSLVNGAHTIGSVHSDFAGGATLNLNTRIEHLNINETQMVLVGHNYSYVVQKTEARTFDGAPVSVLASVIAGAKPHCGRVIVGEEIKYAQQGGALYLKDADGRECKFQISRQERLD
jgi:hypothetical protein